MYDAVLIEGYQQGYKGFQQGEKFVSRNPLKLFVFLVCILPHRSIGPNHIVSFIISNFFSSRDPYK
jgi:hypothetical protein